MSNPGSIDRTGARRRPGGVPIMFQTWKKLLFLHWPIQPEQIRPLIPAGLEIDTWQGTAWVGVTPFTIEAMRPAFAPPVPLISRSHELNVRTYVHHDGVPGVWFFSLDASNRMAVMAARLGFFLPYRHATMSLKEAGERIDFRSVRRRSESVPAKLEASWRLGAHLPPAQPETRDFFLIERYCLYSTQRHRLYRAWIHHDSWPLRSATLEHFSSTMLEAQGLSVAPQAPLVHAQAAPLTVGVWPPKRLRG